MKKQIGGISVGEYLRITRGRRRRLWSALGKLAGILAMCLLCTAAGDYVGPWTGKHSRNLILSDAMALLEESTPREWEAELGMHSVYRHMMRAIDSMRAMAGNEGKTGEYASVYLLNITRRGIAHIKDLATLGVHEQEQVKGLQLLRDDVREK